MRVGRGEDVNGGELVAEGTPETVAAGGASYAGRYLAPLLERGRGLRAETAE